MATSHGVSIRAAKGLYYRPSTFRSRPIEWEETVKADTGLLGLTHQACLLRGQPEEVPGPVRPHRGLQALRGRVRDHAGGSDRQAPDLRDRRRLVRLQPGHQLGPDVGITTQRRRGSGSAGYHTSHSDYQPSPIIPARDRAIPGRTAPPPPQLPGKGPTHLPQEPQAISKHLFPAEPRPASPSARTQGIPTASPDTLR